MGLITGSIASRASIANTCTPEAGIPFGPFTIGDDTHRLRAILKKQECKNENFSLGVHLPQMVLPPVNKGHATLDQICQFYQTIVRL